MSGDNKNDGTGLVQVGNHRMFTRSSNLVRRGLESLSKREGRVVHFPKNRSIGQYCISTTPIPIIYWEYAHIKDARGDVFVPPGMALQLKISPGDSIDLSQLRNLRPDDLDSLDLGETGISDDDLSHIQGLVSLKSLDLFKTNVRGIGIKHLSRLSSLESLSLSHTHVDDEVILRIANFPRLWDLSLSSTLITDTGLGYLGRLENLEILALYETNVTFRGLWELQEALPNCEILY